MSDNEEVLATNGIVTVIRVQAPGSDPIWRRTTMADGDAVCAETKSAATAAIWIKEIEQAPRRSFREVVIEK